MTHWISACQQAGSEARRRRTRSDKQPASQSKGGQGALSLQRGSVSPSPAAIYPSPEQKGPADVPVLRKVQETADFWAVIHLIACNRLVFDSCCRCLPFASLGLLGDGWDRALALLLGKKITKLLSAGQQKQREPPTGSVLKQRLGL
jgi:hypothetical protein